MNNYYDETLNTIQKHLVNKEYDKAYLLIQNELSMPYIPSDFEYKLKSILKTFDYSFSKDDLINENNIENFLYSDDQKQLIAVDYLNNCNLRNYIDLIDNYFNLNGNTNAKVLLIDSLIRQEINHEFLINKDGKHLTFNPINLEIIENLKGYIDSKKSLSEYYLKDPSKLKIALELLYKESILHLPLEYDEGSYMQITVKIEEYIDKAFNS